MSDEKIICCKCNIEMKPDDVLFKYMGFHCKHTLPKCPICGQVYISEELAKTKMREVELTLEEK